MRAAHRGACVSQEYGDRLWLAHISLVPLGEDVADPLTGR